MEKDIEKAFQILESHGIPREQAKTVSNGIEILITRLTSGTSAEFRSGACHSCGKETSNMDFLCEDCE